jgi:hypothetical protein
MPWPRRGVTQVAGHLADHPGDGALAGSVVSAGALGHGQAHGRQDRRVLGAEVLAGVIAPGYLAEVVVDVRRCDIVPARAAPVHQQLIPSATPPPQAQAGGITRALIRASVPGSLITAVSGPR